MRDNRSPRPHRSSKGHRHLIQCVPSRSWDTCIRCRCPAPVFQTFFCLQGMISCLGPQQGSDTISWSGSLLENAGKQLHSARAPYPTAVLIGRGGTPAPDTSVPALRRYTLYQVPMYLHSVFQTFYRLQGMIVHLYSQRSSDTIF